MFHYLGNERLQLWFFSPNVCAAFLTMSALLCIGVFWFLAGRRRSGWKIAGWCVLFPLILLQFIMLATTYSRGGYVACFSALLAACIFSREKRSFLFPALFAAILLLTGDGVSRVQSMGDIGDGSIRNRLLLWKGGTGIIADHWAGGLHELAAVGPLYTRYYQPLWLDEEYLTLISDYLTIAAQYGIGALFFYLAFLLFLLQQGGFLYWKGRNPLLLYACAAVLGYMGAGFFSTCYRFPDVTWLFGVAVLIIAAFVGRAAFRRRIRWTHWSFWPAPVLAAAVCAIILMCGAWVNASLPYSWKYGMTSPESGGIRTLTLLPRGGGNGVRILLPVPRLDDAVRPLLRPLVLAGFSATAFELEAGFGGLDRAEAAVRELAASSGGGRLVLFGSGDEQVIQAIALAARMEPGTIALVAAVDVPFDWPFDELSPKLNIVKCRIPLLLLFHAEAAEESLALGEVAKVRLLELPVPADRQTTDGELIGKRLQHFFAGEWNHGD